MQKAPQGATKVLEVGDGRVLYYGAEVLAKKIGFTREQGMSYAAAKYVIDGADFGLLMLGMVGGNKLGKIPLASLSQEERVALQAAESRAASSVAQSKTGTIWDSIKPSGAYYSGSVIPKSFELTLANGQKIWVDGNATKHLAEYAAVKAENFTPEAVRLVSQEQLQSLSSAVSTAASRGIQYRQIMKVNGWELIFAPPKSAGQLPALYHALYK